MKKMVLAAVAVLVMATGAVAAEAGSVSLLAQGGVHPDNGRASGGMILQYNGVGVGWYAGGDYSPNQSSGFGADLRLNSSIIGTAVPVGPGYLGLYGEAGAHVEPGKGGDPVEGSHPFAVSDPIGRVIIDYVREGGTSTRISLAGGGGLTYKLPLKNAGKITAVDFSAGYHTVKGVNFGLGVSF